MYAWRYLDDQYTEDPDFIFNKPEYRKANYFDYWYLTIWGLAPLGNTQPGL